MNRAIKRLFLPNLLTIIAIALSDLISKRVIFSFIDSQIRSTSELEQLYLLPFLNLVKVWNRGVSFGMFNHINSAPILLSLLQIIIINVLIYILYKGYQKAFEQNKLDLKFKIHSYAISLIIGGAFGNLIDRLQNGAVADFIDLHAFDYHWPAFNIADSAICIGVAILIIQDLFCKKTHS